MVRSSLVAAALVLAIAACTPPQVPQAVGGVLVDDSNGAGQGCSVAMNGASVYAAYQGPFSVAGVKMARSTDYGATWPNIATIDANGIGATNTIVVNNTVYVSYAGVSPNDDVRFARSDDSGATWATKVLEAGSATPEVAMAVVEPHVYLLYSHWTGTNMDLHLLHSGDRGDTFDPPTTVVTTGNTAEPTLVANGTSLYALYFDEASLTNYSISSANGGAAWTTPVSLGAGNRAGALQLSGTTLLAPYNPVGTNDYALVTSVNQGVTWTPQMLNLPDLAGGLPLVTSGNTVYAAYDYTDGTYSALRFARSDDLGATWPAGSLTRMFLSAGNGSMVQHAQMARSGTHLVLAFFDGSDQVFRVAISSDDGATW